MRLARTVFAAFLVSSFLAGIIHGVILGSDYAPFYGSLLRGDADSNWRIWLLPVRHLMFVGGLIWVALHLPTRHSSLRRGVVLGVVAWLIGNAQIWLTWYIEQPWPDSLVVKQLGLEFVSSMLIGLTIAFAWGRTQVQVPTGKSQVGSNWRTTIQGFR